MQQKVFYSIKKSYGNDLPTKGMGFITDTDLTVALISKSGNPYVKVFEDCLRRCNKVTGKTNEFKGTYEEFFEIDNETHSISYDIWFVLK